MTNQEFNKAFTIAASQAVLPLDLDVFDGFGLPNFKQVFVTLRQVAALIRWQALQFNGEWDANNLQEVANLGRHRFVIIGNDSDDMKALCTALQTA